MRNEVAHGHAPKKELGSASIFWKSDRAGRARSPAPHLPSDVVVEPRPRRSRTTSAEPDDRADAERAPIAPSIARRQEGDVVSARRSRPAARSRSAAAALPAEPGTAAEGSNTEVSAPQAGGIGIALGSGTWRRRRRRAALVEAMVRPGLGARAPTRRSELLRRTGVEVVPAAAFSRTSASRARRRGRSRRKPFKIRAMLAPLSEARRSWARRARGRRGGRPA